MSVVPVRESLSFACGIDDYNTTVFDCLFCNMQVQSVEDIQFYLNCKVGCGGKGDTSICSMCVCGVCCSSTVTS
jgi:hypothetical protein